MTNHKSRSDEALSRALRMDPEIELKQQIIKQLKEMNEITIKYGASCLSSQFIRGYISGSSAAKEIKIPTHWYEGMVNEVKKSCGG